MTCKVPGGWQDSRTPGIALVRGDVVNHRGRRQPALPLALNTQGMLTQVTVPVAAPAAVIAPLGRRTTLPVILPVDLLPVSFVIPALVRGEFGAAGLTAGPRRCVGAHMPLSLSNAKGPPRFQDGPCRVYRASAFHTKRNLSK